jgi:hypothetical protein
MARGWESKSVEDQQAEFSGNSGAANPSAPREEKEKASGRRRLQLARTNVSNQLHLAQNPRYIELLTRELEELDRQISALA